MIIYHLPIKIQQTWPERVGIIHFQVTWKLNLKVVQVDVPSTKTWEYPPKNGILKRIFPFPKVGYVSSLEGMSLFFLYIEKYMCCISLCLFVKNNGKYFNGASCHFWIGFLPSISRQSPAVNFWEDWGTYTRNHKGQHCSLAIRKLGNHPKKYHDLLVEVPFCSAVYVSLCFGGG